MGLANGPPDPLRIRRSQNVNRCQLARRLGQLAAWGMNATTPPPAAYCDGYDYDDCSAFTPITTKATTTTTTTTTATDTTNIPTPTSFLPPTPPPDLLHLLLVLLVLLPVQVMLLVNIAMVHLVDEYYSTLTTMCHCCHCSDYIKCRWCWHQYAIVDCATVLPLITAICV